MSKLKFAIIGMGRMGITHYAIIKSHPDIEIESVVDTSSLILSIFHKYISVKTFKDYNEMLASTNPDAVLICTPPNLNFSMLEKFADRKISVFVEKPFAVKFGESLELDKLYKNRGLVNQVGYVNRFNDVFVKVKELVENYVIGPVIRFKSEMYSSTIIKSEEGSGWRTSRESGGGAVFEMASHAVDLVNFIVGKPDRIVGSSFSYVYSKKVEDAASATFLYKNGMSGTLNINWSDTSYRKPINKIELFGKLGRILADQYFIKIFLNKQNERFDLRQGWNTLYITDIFKPVPFYVRGNEFTRQLYHFVECIQNKDIKNMCTFTDGANVLEVIDSIFNDYEQNGRM